MELKFKVWNEFSLCKLDDEFRVRYGPVPYWMRSKMSFVTSRPDFCMDIITVTSSGRRQTLSKHLNCLLIIQEVSSLLEYHLTENEVNKIFFSTLSTAVTISDQISTKLQGLLMVIYTNYISVVLLGDAKAKTVPNKSSGKSSTSSHKGKKKSRGKMASVPKPCNVDAGALERSMVITLLSSS